MLPVDTTFLRIMKRLPILFAFRQRMIRSMFPPVPESICYLLDGILQRLRIDLAKPRVYLLQCDKLSLGSIVAYSYSATTPHHRHIVKRAVVCHAAAAEALGEELRLFRGGIDPVFKRFQHDTNILIFCLIINKKKHQNEQVQCLVPFDLQCGIPHRILAKIPLQPGALSRGRKTQDSISAGCLSSWNHHSGYGSDA